MCSCYVAKFDGFLYGVTDVRIREVVSVREVKTDDNNVKACVGKLCEVLNVGGSAIAGENVEKDI